MVDDRRTVRPVTEPIDLSNVATPDLIRRWIEERDATAGAELDRRGVEPPPLELGPKPVVLAR